MATERFTPRLGLPYINASQAQPEVKINIVWDIMDLVLSPLEVKAFGASVADDGQPIGTLLFVDCDVEYLSNGIAKITPHGGGSSGGGGSSSLTIEEIGGVSPGESVIDPPILKISGATVERLSDGNALLIIATHAAPPLRATFASVLGAAMAPPVPDVLTYVDRDCTLCELIVNGQGGPGSATIEIWKAALASHYPPVIADDITGGANVVLSSASTHDDSTLSGFTTAFSKGDFLLCRLISNVNFTSLTITFRMK
jgi:hypothetical protein